MQPKQRTQRERMKRNILKTAQILKNSFFIVLIITISYACEKNETISEDPVTVTFKGKVQKGPFILGSTITISELDAKMNPTGRTYNTTILDNSGSFELENVTMESNYVQLTANGFYFNERTGKISEAQLTLNCIADVTNLEYSNINILSHIEYERTKYLIKNGLTFENAKEKAQQEILEIFNISVTDPINSEHLDISKSGDENAILLAVSVILQGYNKTGDFTELINGINSDIKEDGILDDSDLGGELINSVTLLNLDAVRTNLETRYNEIGVDFEIPDFEKHILNFIENTSFPSTIGFTFPPVGEMGVNCLHPDTIFVYDKNLNNAPEYTLCVDVPENRSLSISAQGYGFGVYFNTGTNMEYSSIEGDPDLFTFRTTASGVCEHKVVFQYMGHYPAVEEKLIHFEYFADDDEEPFFIKDVRLLTDWTPPPDTTNRK